MKIYEAILAGEVRAYGQLSDIIRARGGTYNELYELVCSIFEKAGRVPPPLEEFDDIMLECDEIDRG